MLLAEVAPGDLRGQALFTGNIALLLGFLASAAANQALHPHPWGWRASSALAAAPAAGLAALLPFVGESAQALLQRGDASGARAVRWGAGRGRGRTGWRRAVGVTRAQQRQMRARWDMFGSSPTPRHAC